MSDLLQSLGITVHEPYAERNLDRRPDLVVVGNAISRGNVELERVLDERIPFCSMASMVHDEFLAGREPLIVAGTHGKTTTTFSTESSVCTVVSYRWCRGELLHELYGEANEAVHPRGR